MKACHLETFTSAIPGIENISTCSNLQYIRLHSLGTVPPFQFPERVLAVFSRYEVPIFLITTSSTNLSLAVRLNPETSRMISHALSGIAAVIQENDITGICIQGTFHWEEATIKEKIIDLLRQVSIRMISYGSDPGRLSVVLRESDRETALRALSCCKENIRKTAG